MFKVYVGSVVIRMVDLWDFGLPKKKKKTLVSVFLSTYAQAL